MANPADTQTTNIVAVQGVFGPEPDFTLQYFVGPAGTPFYPPTSPFIDGATITNSTIDSTVIGGSTPAAAHFTNLETVTGQVTTLPTADNDIANKQYVDSVAQGLDIKAACAYTTTGNITLSGLATQAGGDWGSSLTAGTRILVKNQATSAENGIYAASATGWTRTADMNVWAEVPSAFTFIQQGTTLSDTGWVCTADPGGTIGVTAMPWTQFSGAGTYLAGNGLQIVGNTFSVKPNGTSLDASSSGLKISDTYAGQTSITTLGTIATGTWQGGTIGVAYGGTGAATFSAGYVKASGTTAFTTVATIPNTDITGLGTMSTQNATSVAITGGSAALSTLKTLGLTGYLYGNDTSAVTASTTIPNTAITGLGTMSTQNANAVAITGGTATGLTNLGADYLQFNTSASVSAAVGKIWWDGGTTMNVGMTTNVTSHVSEDLFFYVKASSAISKGDLCTFTGVVGASGVITAGPAGSGITNADYIVGVAAENIANNNFGLIQWFGVLRGIDTSAYVDGDILYYNSSAGQFTSTYPTSGIIVAVAAVIHAGNGGSGSIQIRPTKTQRISAGTGISVSQTASGSTVSLSTPVSIANGGTNGTDTPTAGGIAYGSGTAYAFTSVGTSGQVLTSNGSGAPTWSTPTAYATVTDDTTTNATRYPLFANQTTGNLSTEYTASTKYQFNPSTGILTATGFSGSGANLTSLPAGQLSGTIPSAVLGNSTVYIGTTGIALNRSSASQSLTGVSIDGSAGSATTATTATNAVNVGVTDNTSTNSDYYPTFVTNTTGNLPITVSSTKLKYNPSTGVLTATGGAGGGTF